MTPGEVRTILTILATAHDRAVPDGLADVWSATLADIPFDLGRAAVIELLQSSPYLPKIAEIRERARLIDAEQERAEKRRLQIASRGQSRTEPERTGADMVRHVLGALADAGQDPRSGRFLGRKRAGDIAEDAVAEWLRKTAQETP